MTKINQITYPDYIFRSTDQMQIGNWNDSGYDMKRMDQELP